MTTGRLLRDAALQNPDQRRRTCRIYSINVELFATPSPIRCKMLRLSGAGSVPSWISSLHDRTGRTGDWINPKISQRFKRDSVIGIRSADFIRARGQMRRLAEAGHMACTRPGGITDCCSCKKGQWYGPPPTEGGRFTYGFQTLRQLHDLAVL